MTSKVLTLTPRETSLLNIIDPALFDQIVTIERPGDRPVTNIHVNGRLWASVIDEVLLERLDRDPKKLEIWVANVIKNLLQCLKEGVDIWAEKLEDTKHDFLMRCAP